MSAGPPSHDAPAPADVPHCYRHPNRETLVRCTRCDRPICPECMRDSAVGFQCPDDVALGRRTVRAPRTSVGALLRDAPPYTTGVLVAANVVVYVITGLQSPGGLADPAQPRLHSLFYLWQLQPATVYHDHAYWRLLTSAFLHVSPLHIAANMITLAIIGPPLERVLGRVRFTVVYLLAALGGSALIYAAGAPLQPVVGASGAIFGLFGAALVMARRLGIDLQWLIGVIVLNFILTFSVSGISKLGHVGGFITGGLAGLAIAGWPPTRQRLSGRIQAGGLGGIALVIVLVVALAPTLSSQLTNAAGIEGAYQVGHVLRVGPQAAPAQHDQLVARVDLQRDTA
jgi:membrane associated rhomboid family serine protease